MGLRYIYLLWNCFEDQVARTALRKYKWYPKPKLQDGMRKFGLLFMPLDPTYAWFEKMILERSIAFKHYILPLNLSLLCERWIETSLVELLWTDGTGEEYAPLITADVTGTVLGVLPHTVVTVPVSFRDGGQLRLIGGGEGGQEIHICVQNTV